MEDKNFFRMQLAMSDNGLASFETNLNRMIAMIIYVAGHRMNVDEIRNELATNYELAFTNEEIIHAIEKKHSGIIQEDTTSRIERHGQYYTYHEVVYKLDEDTYRKLTERKKNIDDTVIFKKFVSYAKENGLDLDEKQFKELLLSFLYHIFDTNKETLIFFLSKKGNSKHSLEQLKLTENQKRDINLFLNWDNREKDLFIYKTVSYCVEYCMLTVKKGGDNYRNIFAGKRFYLDTNVIIRLAGINNEERKSVIKAFIDKCTENGIEIYYTNFTYQEIEETLTYNINLISRLLHGHRMVNKNHIAYYSQPHTNLDFINIYDEWAKKNSSRYNDFKAFKKYLMSIVKDILRRFKKIDGISSEKTNIDEYSKLTESLTTYKMQKHAKTYEKSIKIDVENFMFINARRSKGRVDSFYDIKDFLISTDANLCEWGKEISPGSTPSVVLPSVWYSLLLKMQGRSDDDYKAFNLFLNQRYKIEFDSLAETKEEILNIIQNLDEPVDIKDLMLDEIKIRLEESNDISIEPARIVEQSKESVILQKAQEIYSKKEKDSKKLAQIELIRQLAETKADDKQDLVRKLENSVLLIRILIGIINILCVAIPLILNIDTMDSFSLSNVISVVKDDCISYVIALCLTVVQCILDPVVKLYSNCNSFEKVRDKEVKRLEDKLKKSTKL